MTDTAVSRLLTVVTDDEVDYDGLHAWVTDDGYAFQVPGTDRAGLSEAAFREVATNHEVYVRNWHFFTQELSVEPARRAFLRWLDHAEEHDVPARYDALAEDGFTREWGQLRITTTLADGDHRQYEIRHEDDLDTDAEALTTHDDPLDARQLVRHDEDGRYRPLKTAPTLPAGWRFAALSPAELVEAVGFIYPATIQNWHREREGELDVDHWHETIQRQTGIYGVVKTWDRQEGHEHVNWVAEACCDDSQCLKRREWEYADDEELDVDSGGSPRHGGGETADGGDGEFPCREPCSLVISAARQWTKLEGEQARTYEFELTPSEKEQIEAIIGAVADDRTDEIREADIYEDANRYRTRFLRAKLFDDDGNLCGVPTEDDD